MTRWYTGAYEVDGRIVPVDARFSTVRLEDARRWVAEQQSHCGTMEIFVAFMDKPEWKRL